MHVTISIYTESCKKRFTLYIVMSDVGEDEMTMIGNMLPE